MLRKPDAAFWLEFLRPAPAPTEADRARRFRIARFALGAVTLISFLYAIPTLLIDADNLARVAAVTGLTGLVFALGMWMASLGREGLARSILMLTLTVQLATLMWLSGNQLLIVVFAPVLAALARVLYSADEQWQRGLFVLAGVALFASGMLFELTPVLDFTQVSPLLIGASRVINVVLALMSLLAIIATYDNEVLRSEAALDIERLKSEQLLQAVLPEPIVEELRAGASSIARRHEEVTVLFADIAGFTPWSSGQLPEQVVSQLERIFSRFDRLVLDAGVEKIKTIGDAYMVIAGAPRAQPDHAERMANLALAMREEIRLLREETGIAMDLRLGLHSGELIGGVIGVMRFSYDVWGDTVNTASRMESHGEPGRIQITSATRDRLPAHFLVHERGDIEVKGKGTMRTWWLERNRQTQADSPE